MNTAAWSATRLSRVEDAGLNASAPPQQRWVDGWLVRLCPGKAKRARCINALAVGRLPLVERLALVEADFRAVGLPLVLRITPFTQPGSLDEDLDALGLHRFDPTHVLVADLSALPAVAGLPPGLDLHLEGPQPYAATVGALRGSPVDQQLAHAERLATSPVPYQGWVLRRGADVLACGQTAREGEQVGLYDVFTAPAARGQGLSTALCAELLRRARGDGARSAYLQVDVANAPALKVYRRLGFVHGYDYHYRARDPAAA